MMEWPHLLNLTRFMDPLYTDDRDRPAYMQDADRIVFSLSFRRLANKTQVHPLYENDHLHHRLIHSVETSATGRSIGIQIGSWLEDNGIIESEDRHKIAGVVQAACLAHDIGNPPFGHSGEEAIGEWFKERFRKGSGIFDHIDSADKDEFIHFEGNAQGFRILSRLEMYRNNGGMRLTNAVLGAFSKYPITADEKKLNFSKYCGTKKFGVFNSDYGNLCEIADTLGLVGCVGGVKKWYRRHPLVFAVEASDDICYNIIDIEDAFLSGDLSFDQAFEALQPLARAPAGYLTAKNNEEQIGYLRALSIGRAISASVEAFKNNYSDIMNGDFSESLVEVSSKKSEFLQIKTLARNKIFTSKRKTELEVIGRNALWIVLDSLYDVIDQLFKNNWNCESLNSYQRQLIDTLKIDIRDVNSPYNALHALTDFVSGMTDRYAIRAARMLSGGH